MPTPAEIFASMSTNIAKHADQATAVNSVFQFDITGDDGGTWTVNLKQGTTSDFVTNGPSDAANVTIAMSSADWTGITSGAVNPMQAFMMGKIKVKGDMGLALKLQNILALAKG
jgi:putative sterol carrier protein